jgi:hypothetical protein
MSWIPSIVLVFMVLASVGNLVGAQMGGFRKSAGSCASDAVFQALLAVWLYWGSGLF